MSWLWMALFYGERTVRWTGVFFLLAARDRNRPLMLAAERELLRCARIIRGLGEGDAPEVHTMWRLLRSWRLSSDVAP